MTNNETIVNGNTTDDEIIEIPEFVAVDLDDPKNNDIKPYLDVDRRRNYLIDNDWVLYSNGHKYVKNPIMIRNGVRIIKWVWRNFSIINPRGFFGTPYDLHNYIRFKHRSSVQFDETPGSHFDKISNRESAAFIELAVSYGQIWVVNSYLRKRCGISLRQIPYFTQCFSSIQDIWVVKNNDIKLIDFASVFYYLYLRDEHGQWGAEWGINRLTEIREAYYGKQ